jgi:hypothetical protein
MRIVWWRCTLAGLSRSFSRISFLAFAGWLSARFVAFIVIGCGAVAVGSVTVTAGSIFSSRRIVYVSTGFAVIMRL